jgi:signal peptidase I
MGDNRTGSSDSRSWGTLPRDKIVGKAWIAYWPLREAGFVDAPRF